MQTKTCKIIFTSPELLVLGHMHRLYPRPRKLGELLLSAFDSTLESIHVHNPHSLTVVKVDLLTLYSVVPNGS